MTSIVNYDDILYSMLCNEGSIENFFDTIFEFLSRRTDFFKTQEDCLEISEAEKIIQSVMHKYARASSPVPVEEYVAEECVVTEESQECVSEMEDKIIPLEKKIADLRCSDGESYNGAVLEAYSWAQTQQDVDIRVKVPACVVSGRAVRVLIERSRLLVSCREEDGRWSERVSGRLHAPVAPSSSTWTLVPGEHVHVYLWKCRAGWWSRALVGDPPIDPRSVDPHTPLPDMDDDAQRHIRRLIHTAHHNDTAHEEVLRRAWEAEGSPFAGTPFDPDAIRLHNPQQLLAAADQ